MLHKSAGKLKKKSTSTCESSKQRHIYKNTFYPQYLHYFNA